MEQPGFNFSAPPVDPTVVPPAGPAVAPSAHVEARHASWTGARSVVETWTARESAYLQLLQNAGSLSDHEAAALLQWQLCSVNSVRGALEKRARKAKKPRVFATDGFDVHTFVDGSGKTRTTKRTRWRLVRCA